MDDERAARSAHEGSGTNQKPGEGLPLGGVWVEITVHLAGWWTGGDVRAHYASTDPSKKGPDSHGVGALHTRAAN